MSKKTDSSLLPDSRSAKLLKVAMDEQGFVPKTKRDQHFVVDDEVISQAVSLANMPRGTTVIEIGPGCGQFTRELLEAGHHVYAFEIDIRLQPMLERLQPSSLEVVYSDAIRAPWPEAEAVFSNLPFSISEPFMEKVALHESVVNLTLIIGHKLAHMLRPAAGVSKMKLMLESHFKITKRFTIPRAAFFPSPPQDCMLFTAERIELGSGNFYHKFWQQFFRMKETSLVAAIRHSLPPLKRGRHLSVRDLGISERELSWPASRISNQQLVLIQRGLEAALRSKPGRESEYYR